ncbi:hypothetical protein [Psychromonas sp. MME2]|uniref:hypothetical protein n=1 Tax=Psychromonas sp. MME2 TaxID=3231033 RepID=UPI00339C5964
MDIITTQLDEFSDVTSSEYAALLAERNLGVAALVATDVYFDKSINLLLPASIKALTTDSQLNLFGIKSNQLNTSSGYYARVYSDDFAKSPILVNRGTEMGSIRDWATNVGQAMGFEVDQYQEAIAVAKTISGTTEGENVRFVGHSLGGGLASAQSMVTGHSAITFNSAGLNLKTVQDYGVKSFDNASTQIESYALNGEVLTWVQESSWLSGVAPDAIGHRNPLSVQNFSHQSSPSMIDKHGMTYFAQAMGF